MKKTCDLRLRITEAERAAVDELLKKTNMSQAALLRMFVINGLSEFGTKDALGERLESLELRLEKTDETLLRIVKLTDAACVLAASAVSLLAALDLPRIAGSSEEEVVGRIHKGMRLAVTLGNELAAKHLDGRSI